MIDQIDDSTISRSELIDLLLIERQQILQEIATERRKVAALTQAILEINFAFGRRLRPHLLPTLNDAINAAKDII